jgi:hypothetical protein
MKMDLCDLRRNLRAFFFAKDRDVSLQPNRHFYLGNGAILDDATTFVGMIVMFSGYEGDLPDNWAICDGNNGTPPLQDRFIIGAGSTYAVGAVGGAATINIAHSHSGNTGYESSHTHSNGSYATDNDTHAHSISHVFDLIAESGVTLNVVISSTTANDTHSHDVTGTSSAGSSHRHSISSSLSAAQSILPPFYALAFVMRLS